MTSRNTRRFVYWLNYLPAVWHCQGRDAAPDHGSTRATPRCGSAACAPTTSRWCCASVATSPRTARPGPTIAAATGLTRATVSALVDDLIGGRLLAEVEPGAADRRRAAGRRAGARARTARPGSAWRSTSTTWPPAWSTSAGAVRHRLVEHADQRPRHARRGAGRPGRARRAGPATRPPRTACRWPAPRSPCPAWSPPTAWSGSRPTSAGGTCDVRGAAAPAELAGLPVTVDNEANLAALGELHAAAGGRPQLPLRLRRDRHRRRHRAGRRAASAAPAAGAARSATCTVRPGRAALPLRRARLPGAVRRAGGAAARRRGRPTAGRLPTRRRRTARAGRRRHRARRGPRRRGQPARRGHRSCSAASTPRCRPGCAPAIEAELRPPGADRGPGHRSRCARRCSARTRRCAGAADSVIRAVRDDPAACLSRASSRPSEPSSEAARRPRRRRRGELGQPAQQRRPAGGRHPVQHRRPARRRRAARSSSSSCREDGVRYSAISRRSARPGTRSTRPEATSRSHSRLAEDRIMLQLGGQAAQVDALGALDHDQRVELGPGQPRSGLLAGRVPHGQQRLAPRRRRPRRASGPAHPAHGERPWCSRDYPYGRNCRRR